MNAPEFVIQSHTHGRLGCSQFGAVTNKIAVNIPVQVFFVAVFLFRLGKYLETGFLGHMVSICL